MYLDIGLLFPINVGSASSSIMSSGRDCSISVTDGEVVEVAFGEKVLS
jgi:hypothetical protein